MTTQPLKPRSTPVATNLRNVTIPSRPPKAMSYRPGTENTKFPLLCFSGRSAISMNVVTVAAWIHHVPIANSKDVRCKRPCGPLLSHGRHFVFAKDDEVLTALLSLGHPGSSTTSAAGCCCTPRNLVPVALGQLQDQQDEDTPPSTRTPSHP